MGLLIKGILFWGIVIASGVGILLMLNFSELSLRGKALSITILLVSALLRYLFLPDDEANVVSGYNYLHKIIK